MSNINLTNIEFGNNAINKLYFVAKTYKKALLITGSGSIKKSGLYDHIKQQLKLANIELVEFWNIKPNPTHTQINEAAQVGIHNHVDFIIAAGGGSAIDASKVIATMISNPKIKDVWKLIIQEDKYENKPIDIIAIITLAGSASENNSGSVITNSILQMKKSIRTRAPILAIEDPTYTFSVSPWQTASGIFDCFSHITEQWFSLQGSFNWTDNYNIGLLKTLLTNAPKVIANPHDYAARANILFTTSMALNGLSSFEMPSSDWSVHQLAHAIAGIYDTTHGATLALITPTYWRYMADHFKVFKERLVELGQAIFGITSIDKIIEKLINFIKMLKLPLKYSDFENLKNMNESQIKEFVPKVASKIISKENAEEIFNLIPQ